MARVEYPNTDSPDAQQMAEQIRAARDGRLPNLFRMQLHNPAIADGWLRLGTAVRYKSELPDNVRELTICLVARLTGAEYEWQAHSRLALAAGYTDAQLQAILEWRSGSFDAREQAALALAEGLTRTITVDEATFDQARAQFPARQVVELVTTIAYYNMVARFLEGLQIDPEG